MRAARTGSPPAHSAPSPSNTSGAGGYDGRRRFSPHVHVRVRLIFGVGSSIETAQLLDSFIATGRLPAKPIAKQMYSVRSSVRGVRAITPLTRRCGRWPAVLDTSVPGGVTGFWTCVLASCVGSPSPGIQILVVVGVVVVVVVVGMAVHRAAFTFAVHVT